MGIMSAILTRPSQRTQMEATLVGISMVMLASISTSIYIVFFSESSLFIKILTSLGGVGVFLFMFSNLAMTYIQYRSYKTVMGMYPVSAKLLMKIEEAKQIKDELEKLINSTQLKGGN